MSPHRGWRHSNESRARIAAANLGRRHTTETREKIADANRRRQYTKLSPEHRAAVSAANRGRPFSSQHCDRISEALIAFYERVSPPASAAARAWREHRRLCKRALRGRRRKEKN
jgi:hypothetical protein